MDIGCEYGSEINLFSVDSWNAWINEVLDDCQTVFASWPFFSYYTDDRVYMDLDKLLSPEDLQWLYDQGMIVQTRSDVQTQGIPHGIDISRLPFGQDCLTTKGPCYLVFIRNTDQPENCLRLWEHIKNWNLEDTQ